MRFSVTFCKSFIPLRRIYLDSILQQGVTTPLTDSAFHYLFRVLRCRDGESVVAFNGDGCDYTATLTQTDKKNATITVTDKTINDKESPLHTTLIQGVSKGDKMDHAVQKAVELGVNVVQPVQTMFSAVKFDEKRLQKKQQHWHSIMVNACEQSERAVLPTLSPLCDFSSAITHVEAACKLILHPYALPDTQQFTQLQALIPPSVALLVGAEGGFSETELTMALQRGFMPISLGKRILRTETAAVSALSIVQLLWGDYVR